MERVHFDGIAAAERGHWWYVGPREIIASQLRQLALPTDAQIIEVGAGSGGNLQMLSRFGSVSATEMDGASRDRATARGICEVQNGWLPDGLPFGSSSADVIGLFDVIEHVERDHDALAALHDVLKPGGHLLVTVPAHQWLWSRHDEIAHHFRRYSPRRLRADLQAAGLNVDRVTYFNSVLFPAAVAVRTLNLPGRDGRSLGGKEPPRLVNAALSEVLRLEARMLRRVNLPFGLSLLAVARKL